MTTSLDVIMTSNDVVFQKYFSTTPRVIYSIYISYILNYALSRGCNEDSSLFEGGRVEDAEVEGGKYE